MYIHPPQHTLTSFEYIGDDKSADVQCALGNLLYAMLTLFTAIISLDECELTAKCRRS